MDERELEVVIARAAHKAAEDAVAAANRQACGRCALCVEPDFAERHEKHHEAMDEFLLFIRRVNEAKWTTFKAVLSTLGVGLVMAFLWFFFGIKQP